MSFERQVPPKADAVKHSYQIAVCSSQVLAAITEFAAATPPNFHIPVLFQVIEHHVVQPQSVGLTNCGMEP